MLASNYRCLAQKAKQPLKTGLMALIIAMSNVGMETSHATNIMNTSPVGSGFTVTAADLAFILKQIKISEHHAANTTPATGPCSALVGSGTNQIPSPLLSFGLRTVDGSCNNLQSGQETFGASDQPFPRLTTPNFERPAESPPPLFGPGSPTNYNQTDGAVYDSRPRMISNLIVDQTSTNPAAVFVAGNPARTQGNQGVVSCTTHPADPYCVPEFETLFIPNVTTDVGLSPPFNSLFTIFGQFFDHGLDKITNGGAGTVFVPLKDDDPLIAGPDHILGNYDDLPVEKRFMVLTRGTIVPGADGIRSAPNTDTPFVDQSQTYTSHSSHQVFLREYVLSADKPVATGKFLSESDGGIAKWKTVKAQAATKLGLQLSDADATNIPMVAADQYGNFIPGSVRGMPQYVTTNNTGLVEGDPSADSGRGVSVPSDVVRINTAFLNDIAHSAAPVFSAPGVLSPDEDLVAGKSLDKPVCPTGVTSCYDDELLDLHFICGDGRCNENIALTAVHQIFHMEHDRLVDEYINPTGGVLAQNPDLLAAYQDVKLTPDTPATPGFKTFTYEERLFQAARFVNEMQYQHLVFEEFARKVQPAINPFQPFAFNQTDTNPAIRAEFAHAVYRFGHSMLHDTVPRLNDAASVAQGAPLHNDIPLLDGFLNPAAFKDGGNGVILDAHKATGAIIMGLSDQTGNEIDEFVADTLRNGLLGLPLDLPSLNMMRARSEGIPSLNNVRKQIYAATNDGQLVPYTNWVDFGENIRHYVSLTNFIAAYGTHPLITNLDPDGGGPILPGSLKARRMAADQIVNGTVLPGPDGVQGDDPSTVADESLDDISPPTSLERSDFMFSFSRPDCVPDGVYKTCWADVGGVSQTGLDDVDLWVGGLAEITNLFGGLLGSTFNYVFEKQLTDLQNGDRFYYLARTPGMNLRTQLEGNSFAELVMRNTPSHTLKADPFATADCKFELANLHGTAADFAALGSTVANDPTSECDETALLIRLPDGTIKYRASNTVDPPGINGQSVYNGTESADSFYGGNDNDTFWGGLGDDFIQGGGGDDVALGGEGDDIIIDFAGADILKGGPGNDAIDGGPGLDIIMPNAGQDFTNGGANINETFAGEGNDLAIAGQGEDAVFGDGGDDWEEGGDQPDLLIGDSSTLFFDDHNMPGNDILIGQAGDDDYDMEGGDDIGVAGPGVEKVAGASGYDWEIGLGDPQPQDADLSLPIVNVLPINGVRDRYNEIEALSGWKFNDTLRGDSVIPSQVNGGGFIGCDALDQDGLDRITGLDALVPPLTVPSGPIIAASVTNYCQLTGNVWGEGNILLGGAGSDTLEGRGADDILDGDKYLNVRLSVKAGLDGADGVDVARDGTGPEIGSTDLMENMPVSGDFGPGTTGMTLQQAVFARKVNPGNIVAVREILTPAVGPADCGAATPLNCDTAVFSGPVREYTITVNTTGELAGSLTVTDNGGAARNLDGVDTLWNIEQLSFCPTPGVVRGTCDSPRTTVSVAPTAAPSPASLAFGNVLINSTSSPLAITVTNNGIANLVVGSATLTGADLASFNMVGNTCTTGKILVRDASCTVTLRFAPTTTGSKFANVVITHNGVNSPTSVPVSGTGTAPIASLSLSSLDFGNQNTFSTSATKTVTLTNTGNANLAISSIALTGTDFARVATPAPSCGATLTAGSTCNINVRFTPHGAGTSTGSITVTDNSNGVPGSTQTVSLSGTGVIQLPMATLTPTVLTFGNVLLGSVFQQSVTLSNTGTGTTPMTINAIGVSTGTGFSRVAGGCGTTLAAGASCLITVRFAPTTALGGGNKIATLTVTDNSGNVLGSQQTVSLSGTGTVAAIDDTFSATANGNTTPQVISFNVRGNDTPSNVSGIVTINNFSVVTNGGATATAAVTGATLGNVSWTLTPTGTTIAARQASKRGTYTVTYTLSNGTATATATYTLTVN